MATTHSETLRSATLTTDAVTGQAVPRNRALLTMLLVTAVSGCGGRTDDKPSAAAPATTATATGAPSSTPSAPISTTTPAPTTGANRYPGKGFRVHEWGTNTVVVGSDGVLQRGLHSGRYPV